MNFLYVPIYFGDYDETYLLANDNYAVVLTHSNYFSLPTPSSFGEGDKVFENF